MNGEVHLIIRSGSQSAETTQWVAGVDTPTNKIYINSTAPAWNCADAQLLLDAIQANGGLTVTCYNSLDVNIGTAFLTTGSAMSANCGGTEDATLEYDPALTTLEIIKVVRFTWSVTTLTETFVDLYPLESISQNFIFQDVGTFAPLGDFTREFRVPASDRNLEAFGLLDSFTFSDTSNVFGTKIPAEIRVDTLPIMRGHIRVIKTFKRNDVLADIQISFYGEAPDLFRSIGDKLLADIEYLPNLDIPLTYANVTSPPSPSELVFGLTDRGQKWDNAGAGRPITNSTQPIFAGDLTPFANAWMLFSKIVNEAGFTLSPTPLQSILSGYWCPWLSNKNLVTQENVGTYYFNAGFASDTAVVDDTLINFPEIVDNGGRYNTFAFQAPVTGYYAFRIWVNVVPVGTFGENIGGIKFYRWTSGSPLAGDVVVNYEVAISGYDQNNGILQSVLLTTVPILMQAGQYIKPYTEFNGTPIFQGNATNDPLTGSGWELFSYQGFYGDTLNTVANAPFVKQVDFVRDILAMHGAVIVPSRTTPQEVGIIPIVDYIATGDNLNWTPKLDITKDITLSPSTDIQRRNFLFSYKNGSDFNSKLYTDNGRTYGEYKILNGYSVAAGANTNEFVTGDLSIKLVAESTPSSYVNGTTIPIPKFINDKGEFINPNLRFLFLADVATLPMYNDTIANLDTASINIFNNYSSVNASVGDYDLNFAPEAPLHAITTNPYRNLFNEYWRDYLNGLYSPESRILEAYFALDLSDILTFKYSDRIWIKDSYWRIIEISDYKVGLYESVKVRLVKITSPAPDCELVPATVVVNGDQTQVISFVDYDGNPQPATSTCCVRYGYQWENQLGQCLSVGTPIISNPGGGTDGFSTVMMMAGSSGTPSNVVARSMSTTISPDNTFSVYVGERMAIDKGNQNTLAVGERLKLDGANRGSTLLGRNVYSNIMGLHYGGGDRASDKEGSQQTGVIVLANKKTFGSAGETLELAPGNDTLTRINLPDNTSITAIYVLQASDVLGNAFYETGSLYIEKIAGTSAASTPIQISTDNSGAFTFTLSIDVTTDHDEHRFIVTSGGSGGYPSLIQVILTLYYTQTR